MIPSYCSPYSSLLAPFGFVTTRRILMYKRPACTSLQTSECSASAASLQTSLTHRFSFPLFRLCQALTFDAQPSPLCRTAFDLQSTLVSPLSLSRTTSLSLPLYCSASATYL